MFGPIGLSILQLVLNGNQTLSMIMMVMLLHLAWPQGLILSFAWRQTQNEIKVPLSLKTEVLDLLWPSWKKGKVERVRSYLVKNHFAEYSPEVEQSLPEWNCVIDMQFKMIVSGKIAYQWNTGDDGSLERGWGSAELLDLLSH